MNSIYSSKQELDWQSACAELDQKRIEIQEVLDSLSAGGSKSEDELLSLMDQGVSTLARFGHELMFRNSTVGDSIQFLRIDIVTKLPDLDYVDTLLSTEALPLVTGTMDGLLAQSRLVASVNSLLYHLMRIRKAAGSSGK